MDDIFIDIQAGRALRRLGELQGKMENKEPLMRDIAGVLADAVEENFDQEGRPSWQDLAPATKKERRRKGYWPGKILQRTGSLASSVTVDWDSESAVAGSNLEYARIHQLGGMAGPGKQVRIPARPFLGMDEDDVDEMVEIVEEFYEV